MEVKNLGQANSKNKNKNNSKRHFRKGVSQLRTLSSIAKRLNISNNHSYEEVRGSKDNDDTCKAVKKAASASAVRLQEIQLCGDSTVLGHQCHRR